MFKKVVLIDNTQLEEILGDLPIIGFYEQLNELLVPTMHMVNVLSHTATV